MHVVPSMLVPKSEPWEFRVVSDFNSLNVHLKKPEVVLQTMEGIKQVLAEYEFHAELDLSIIGREECSEKTPVILPLPTPLEDSEYILWNPKE